MTTITDTYAQKNLSYLVYDQLTLAEPGDSSGYAPTP